MLSPRGRGYYDRFLEGRLATRAGLAFEAQILRKKLPLEPHDQLLDALVTERRLLNFTRPREG
jgi:5-formyltetrahydrofolate cyclo-ligase